MKPQACEQTAAHVCYDIFTENHSFIRIFVINVTQVVIYVQNQKLCSYLSLMLGFYTAYTVCIVVETLNPWRFGFIKTTWYGRYYGIMIFKQHAK